MRTAAQMTRSGGMVVVPSVKYHLPRVDESFREDEYRHTTERLAQAWGDGVLALEKDFSPTLAGDSLSDERARIIRWLEEVPALIRRSAGAASARVALKLMNARHGDSFQLDMVEAAAGAGLELEPVYTGKALAAIADLGSSLDAPVLWLDTHGPR